MIYEFKSRATGSVVMTQSVAERLLAIIGKAPGPKGIITVAEMPAALQALQAAVDAERAAQAAERTNAPGDRAGGKGQAPAGETSTDEPGTHGAISLAQRAFALIDMLKRAHAGERDITWGA